MRSSCHVKKELLAIRQQFLREILTGCIIQVCLVTTSLSFQPSFVFWLIRCGHDFIRMA